MHLGVVAAPPHTNLLQSPSQAADLNSHEILVPEAGDCVLTVQDFYQWTCDIHYLALRGKKKKRDSYTVTT